MYSPTTLFRLIIIAAALMACVSAVAAQQLSSEKINAHALNSLQRKIDRAQHLLSVIPPSENQRDNTDKPTTTKMRSESNVSQSPEIESEIAAAINPDNPNKIVVCAMRTTDNEQADELSFPIYYTSDFGETWNTSSFKPEEVGVNSMAISAGGGDPVLVYDKDGKVHLSWLRVVFNLLSFDIQFVMNHAISEDDGATWTVDDGPVDVGSANILLAGRVIDKEWMVADNNPASPHYGNVYMLYVELNVVSQNEITYQMICNTWSTQTQQWSESVVAISSNDLPFCQFVSPVVTPNGDLHLTVVGAVGLEEFSGIYHSVSTDGGQNFAGPNLVSYFNLACFLGEAGSEPCVEGIGAERTFPSNYLYVNPTNSNLYSIWYADGFTEQLTEGTDVYFSRSTDNGESWSIPQVVNQDTDPLTDNFMPSGTVDAAGTFYVNWYDQRQANDQFPGRTDYYQVRYNDTFDIFVDETPITDLTTTFSTVGVQNGGFGVGEYNTTVNGGGVVMPFWVDGRGNDGQLEIYFAKLNNGVPSSVGSIYSAVRAAKIAPNPFRESSKLFLTIDRGVLNFRAAMLDVNGKVIAQLNLPETMEAGSYTFNLSTEKYPPGTYFIRFTEGSRLLYSIQVTKQ